MLRLLKLPLQIVAFVLTKLSLVPILKIWKPNESMVALKSYQHRAEENNLNVPSLFSKHALKSQLKLQAHCLGVWRGDRPCEPSL